MALLLAWLTKYVPVAPGKQGQEPIGVGSEAGFYQPAKQSQGESKVSVTETSIENKNTKAETGDTMLCLAVRMSF